MTVPWIIKSNKRKI